MTITSDATDNPEIVVQLTGNGTEVSSGLVMMNTPDSDPYGNSIQSRMRIRNDGDESVDLLTVNIEYYFHDSDLDIASLVWDYYWCSFGNVFSITFEDLGQEYVSGSHRANRKMVITFDGSQMLQSGQTADIQFGVHTRSWSYNFDETDDWSYPVGSDSVAQNIVIRDALTGAVLFGHLPQ
ncbi:MAG: cellulose binding domain-containing protein [Chitinispirillaceae bacterium]